MGEDVESVELADFVIDDAYPLLVSVEVWLRVLLLLREQVLGPLGEGRLAIRHGERLIVSRNRISSRIRIRIRSVIDQVVDAASQEVEVLPQV